MRLFGISSGFKGFAAAGLLVSSVALMSPQDSKAACTSTADSGANNCFTFSPTSDSFVIEEYATANLTSNTYAQFGFASNGPSFSLANVAYQFFGESSWNDLGSSGAVSVSSTTAYQAVINDAKVKPGLKLRYTIPAGLVVGTILQSTLLTNNNGANSSGTLVAGINNFAQVDRASTAASVPGPLPVLGAATAFSMSRRLRRRIKSA